MSWSKKYISHEMLWHIKLYEMEILILISVKYKYLKTALEYIYLVTFHHCLSYTLIT